MLDTVLSPIAESLTRESAQRVLDFKLDEATQAHIRTLAEKANEGQLSEAERAEYLEFIEAMDLVGILQAKARKVLSGAAQP